MIYDLGVRPFQETFNLSRKRSLLYQTLSCLKNPKLAAATDF
jgi:hypothetical protein